MTQKSEKNIKMKVFSINNKLEIITHVPYIFIIKLLEYIYIYIYRKIK